MKKKHILNLVTVLPIVGMTISCGDDGNSKNSTNQLLDEAQREADIAAVDGSNIQGRYIAKFVTLNPHVVGTIPGSAQLRREDDSLYAYVRMFAGSPSIPHFQNVHIGNRCPDMNDDANGDGFIDYQEALQVVGPIIIPLDWDIGSQLSANSSWPKAFPNGSYEYLKVTNFNRFWDDIKGTDRNPEDNIVKLAPEDGLPITGKVVLIQGVDPNKEFPDTVAGYGRWKNYQTFPVACGIFIPTSEETGVVYEESIPGPVGPVVEGQDQPAPEGADEIPGTGTVITSGPSNEAGSNDSDSEEDDGTSTTSRPRTETSPTPNPAPTTRPEGDNDGDEENDSGICWPWERDCK